MCGVASSSSFQVTVDSMLWVERRCGNAVASWATRPIAPPECWKKSTVSRFGSAWNPSVIAPGRLGRIGVDET